MMKKNIPYIVGFEGSSLAGKTFSIDLLKNIYEESHHPIFVIKEYVNYAGGHENFPNIIALNNEESLYCAKFFINLESRRMSDIQVWIENYTGNLRPIILVDRLLFSCLAVRREVNDSIGYKLILDTLVSKKCIIPHLTVYLKSPLDITEYTERLTTRTAFRNSEVIYNMQQSYEDFFRYFTQNILNLNPIYTTSYNIDYIFSTINKDLK